MMLIPVYNINVAEAEQTSRLNTGAAVEATGSAIKITDNTYAGDGYEVKFNVDSKWDGAFNGSITITNTGNKAIDNWELSFEMQNNITNIWNAVKKRYFF